MLITEWNTDEAKVVWQEEALNKGIGIGRQDILDMLRSGKSADEVLRTFSEVKGKR